MNAWTLFTLWLRRFLPASRRPVRLRDRRGQYVSTKPTAKRWRKLRGAFDLPERRG
ncbi:MAG: hypothetical protein ACYC2H_09965 [Thermoplasmatota archaeon]